MAGDRKKLRPPHEEPLIKFMQCIRRKPQLSAAEFRRYWDRYKEAWVELGRLSKASRMATSIGLEIDHNTTVQPARGTREPFDGVLEVWWGSGEQVNQCLQDPAIKAKVVTMPPLQDEFIDMASSSFFVASEAERLAKP